MSSFVHVSKPPINILTLWRACELTSDLQSPRAIYLPELARASFCWLPTKNPSHIILLHWFFLALPSLASYFSASRIHQQSAREKLWFWTNSIGSSVRPLVSDSYSQRLSFFSQKILVILMPRSDWGLELNVSLSTTSPVFLFSSTVSFPLFLYAFLGFSFYALPCPFVIMILFLFFLFIIFPKYNIFHPFSGHDVLSLPVQNYFPFFLVKYTVQSLEDYPMP